MANHKKKQDGCFGMVSEACRNMGFKSTNPYYDGRSNQREGKPLSMAQKKAIAEYERLEKKYGNI